MNVEGRTDRAGKFCSLLQPDVPARHVLFRIAEQIHSILFTVSWWVSASNEAEKFSGCSRKKGSIGSHAGFLLMNVNTKAFPFDIIRICDAIQPIKKDYFVQGLDTFELECVQLS